MKQAKHAQTVKYKVFCNRSLVVFVDPTPSDKQTTFCDYPILDKVRGCGGFNKKTHICCFRTV